MTTSPSSPGDLAKIAATIERMRQLRRRAGVPDGMTFEAALGLHIVSATEVERAYLGTEGAVLDLISSKQR